jgi:hypothetical protein
MAGRMHTLSHTYHASKAHNIFKACVADLPGASGAVWFEVASKPVSDAWLPVGVLLDTLLPEESSGPFKITVHFSRLPEPGVSGLYFVPDRSLIHPISCFRLRLLGALMSVAHIL